ncbi:splicing factor U2af large subunit A [Cyclospora cayetanensis]|uniref:Splicing factor U2af large subunit A n=1 Tax=Cyclospora cayetanensis TaxID=88456 RepID=A0A6P6S4T6_9EIME|nr:splicing factor U2af large subunit A [Cyclospora cayetanensis]
MADLDFEAVEQLMEKGDPNSDGSPAGGEGSPVSNGAARSNDGGVFRRAADSEEPSERRSGRAGRRERSLEEVRRRRDGSHEGGSRKGGVRDESPDGRKDQGGSPGFPRREGSEGRKGGGGRAPSLDHRKRMGGRSGGGGSPEVYRESRRSPSPRRNGGWREGPWGRGPPGRDMRARGHGSFRRGFGDDYGRHRGGGDFRRRDRDWWPPGNRRSRSRDRIRRGEPRSPSPVGGRGGAAGGAQVGGGGGGVGGGQQGGPPGEGAPVATRLSAREELLRRQREEELRRKEVEEARRDDLTVLVLNLSLKADERHIYEFFSANAGKIRDIQQIRDQRSGVSKGVAYVEFYTQEAVIKAMALNGISFKGQPLRVQASMAEKNRAARAAKCPTAPAPDAASLQIPMRVYVGGLVGALSTLTRDDLHALFSPFGSIQEITIPTDPNTGDPVGFAFVMFAATGDAHDAMQQMHQFKLAGQELRVGYAADGVRLSGSLPEGAPATPPGAVTAGAGGAPGAGGGGPGVPAHVVAATQVSYEAQLAKQLAEKAASLMRQQQPQLQESNPQQQEGDDDGGIDDDDIGYIHDPSRKQALMQKLMDRSAAALGNPGGTGAPPTASMAGDVPPQQQQASPSTDKQQFLRSSSGPRVGGLAPGVITSNLMLRGMFSPSAAEDEYYFDDIRDDVKEECGKHGTVVQVSLSEKDEEGRVFIKFTAPSVALAAQQALNGRFFGGRQIHAEFATDAMITAVCSGSSKDGGSG